MKMQLIKNLATSMACLGSLLYAPVTHAADPVPLEQNDTSFVQKAAQSGMAEVKMAKLGAEKATNADVKIFAEMLVTDHSKVNEQLKELAATKEVKLSMEPDPAHEATCKKLEDVSSADFDKAFLATMIKGHKKGISSYEAAAKECHDADVKAFATKTLPALKGHLAKAQKLNGESPEEKTATTAGADNTGINARDRDNKKMTPIDQGNNEVDIQSTAQIRKEVVALDNISATAKNVKIITNNGHVTLRGPVNNADEKKIICDIAVRVASKEHVTDELEVKPADK